MPKFDPSRQNAFNDSGGSQFQYRNQPPHFDHSRFELRIPDESKGLPLIVESLAPEIDLVSIFPQIRELVDLQLLRFGAILFRGFHVRGIEAFKNFVEAFGYPLLGYEFGSTPRSKLSEGLYTSTEYPRHQSIPLHNEQAYARVWPMKIWFHCAIAPTHGGATPIADSRDIYRRIDRLIRDRFVEKGLMYLRNYGNGLDLPWSQVFNTEQREEVEFYCRRHGIHYQWKNNGELRTRQICQAVTQHPCTRETLWFNQAHLFHGSALDPEIRESLLSFLEEEDLPRNVYYGDGSPITDAELDEIRGVMNEVEIPVHWKTGDVLMLDNMLTAHGRAPFEGPRQVVVAMTESYQAE